MQRDFRKEALDELRKLLPILYPTKSQACYDDVVTALEIIWELDPNDHDFPLRTQWSRGSQHYWKQVSMSHEYMGTGLGMLAEIACGLHFHAC
jgi:hypothetical protein